MKTLFTGGTKRKQVKIRKGKPVRLVVRGVEFFKGQYGRRASVKVSRPGSKKVAGVVYLPLKAGKVLRRYKGATVLFSRAEVKSGVTCKLLKRAAK